DASTAASRPQAVGKADAACSITGYSVPFNGSSHTAAGSCKGVDGVTVLSGLDKSGTTHTDAGTYNADPWTFTDVTGNYNNTAGTVNDAIGKADAACSITGYSVPFNGSSHTAAGSCKGVDGVTVLSGLDKSGTTHTDAGTYNADPWTFTDVTGNYNNTAGTVNDAIGKADAACSITGYSVPFNGSSHTAA